MLTAVGDKVACTVLTAESADTVLTAGSADTMLTAVGDKVAWYCIDCRVS